jgi:vacuolar iron transporter family protein
LIEINAGVYVRPILAAVQDIRDIGMQNRRERSHAASTGRIFARGLGGDLRDYIFGGMNGAITTFVIVAGVVGADLPTVVAPVIGLANLFANGFATAARRYTNTKRAWDNYDRLHTETVWPKDAAAKDPDLFRFVRSPVQAALNTVAAFILCGLVPLVAYILAPTQTSLCITVTACTLFAIGAAKGCYSASSWWRSGGDTVFLGMCAAALAYAAGHTLRLLINIPIS